MQVLKSITFEIAPGSITGLAGPNACGKTTLIKILLSLVMPDSGTVLFGGKSIKNDFHYRELIGYMPQHPDFPPHLSANELFNLLSCLRNKPASRFGDLIEAFSLEHFIKKPLGTLSTGTRQKVSAVAALMFDAPILILDEPTAGFDPIACSSFKTLILEKARSGTTILLISHIMSELDQLIDKLIFLLDGDLFYSGPVEQIPTKDNSTSLEAAIVNLMRSSSAVKSLERSNG